MENIFEEEKITITKREYDNLKDTESLYEDHIEFIKENVPKTLEPIVKEEIEKFNKSHKEEGSIVSWAEYFSYRIYCEGFFPDSDEVLYESFFDYEGFRKAISKRIDNLGFFDKKAIEEYNDMAEEHYELDAIDKTFYTIVEPLYHEMSDELKDQIEGIYDSYEPDFDDED